MKDMRVTRTITTEFVAPSDMALMCSVCGTSYNHSSMSDDMERQEFVRIAFRGGYGSVFGDGNDVEIDICQHCLKDKLGQFAKISDPHEIGEYLGQDDLHLGPGDV